LLQFTVIFVGVCTPEEGNVSISESKCTNLTSYLSLPDDSKLLLGWKFKTIFNRSILTVCTAHGMFYIQSSSTCIIDQT
jgi:hypothetical protein